MFSALKNYVVNFVSSAGSRKRRADQIASEESAVCSTKRRRLMSTSQYIYKTLFVDGHNSDVTICALDHQWYLHKVYLCQSQYFDRMFNGDWKEKAEDIIDIMIEDDNITYESLNSVFGALYLDEIDLTGLNVIGILATATMFQLDCVIQQCIDTMTETVNGENVVAFYGAADRYGLSDLQTTCFQWLLRNIMWLGCHEGVRDPKLLRQLDPILMTKLISSPDLVVLVSEFCTYLLLCTWAYLLENAGFCGDDVTNVALAYFKDKYSDEQSFVESPEGKQYVQTFEALRFRHIIIFIRDIPPIEEGHVVPATWLLPIYRDRWCSMLRINEVLDKGPRSITEAEFMSNCMRCARHIEQRGQRHWHWKGFNFGIDLIVSFSGTALRFKKNLRPNDSLISSEQERTSNHKRSLMYSMSILHSGPNGFVELYTSQVKTVTLNKFTEVTVVVLPDDVEIDYPVMITGRFLVTTPLSGDITARLHTPDRNNNNNNVAPAAAE